MRKVVIAIGLIEQGDVYLLQLRGDNPVIGGAGLIGCFGGKLEGSEAPIDAIHREIGEETTHQPNKKDFKPLGSVRVISDHKLETVEVHGHVFHLPLGDQIVLEAAEGELVRLPKHEAHQHLDKMTTGTRAVFEQFILGNT